MNATVTCEKCGKPLGVFDGNTCADCSKIDAIRQEIEELKPYAMYADGMVKKSEILQIIDRHMKGDPE